MSGVKADANPIVVDKEVGQDGSTTIFYEKLPYEELWEKPPGGGWMQVNVFARTNSQDEEVRLHGSFSETLKPGEIYEAGIYNPSNNPLSADPVPLASLKLFARLHY